MDYGVPTLSEATTYSSVLAALLDYTGVLDRIGGDMGVGMNAALSSFLVMVIANHYSLNHKGASKAKIYVPVKGAVYSGLFATLLVRVLGNNIQNPNLLGALGTFAGTHLAASQGIPST